MGRELDWGWWEVQVRAPVSSMKPWTIYPQMMQTNIPGVFAAGDAVTFPLAWRNNRKVNIPHWQMAHAQGMASPMAGWGMGGCPRVSASPSPTPQLLTLGPGCRLQSYSKICGGLSGQPYPGDQASSQSKACGPSPSCALWIPHSASHSTPHQLSLSFSFVLKDTRSPGRKGFSRTGASSPLSASVSLGPLSWLWELSCLNQAPGRLLSGPGNPGSVGNCLLCSLRNSFPRSPSLRSCVHCAFLVWAPKLPVPAS